MTGGYLEEIKRDIHDIEFNYECRLFGLFAPKINLSSTFLHHIVVFYTP